MTCACLKAGHHYEHNIHWYVGGVGEMSLLSTDPKSMEWQNLAQTKIREAFDLFDKDKTDAVVQEEVGTMMRYLGAYPTERQLVLEILPGIRMLIIGYQRIRLLGLGLRLGLGLGLG